ncbi:hypothetical protein SO802_029014 [Lithocarpus litseifolius]|uniref:SCP domain-containing protein n=1 Tax=Lithocarpus litseifolius TaxID=425828 RepID=A0AAW2BRV2_9ROSI
MMTFKISLATVCVIGLATVHVSLAQNSPQDYLNAHNAARAQGENLAWGSRDLSGTAAVNMWVAEKPKYDYDSNSCVGGECLHYTQSPPIVASGRDASVATASDASPDLSVSPSIELTVAVAIAVDASPDLARRCQLATLRLTTLQLVPSGDTSILRIHPATLRLPPPNGDPSASTVHLPRTGDHSPSSHRRPIPVLRIGMNVVVSYYIPTFYIG